MSVIRTNTKRDASKEAIKVRSSVLVAIQSTSFMHYIFLSKIIMCKKNKKKYLQKRSV